MTNRKDVFYFKQFAVKHSESAMKVGFDGILLGAWCDIEKDKVIIRVHPEDYEFLLNIGELKETLNIENLVIKKDQSIRMRGGCIVETEYSKLDATIENQLSIIEDLLRREKC